MTVKKISKKTKTAYTRMMPLPGSTSQHGKRQKHDKQHRSSTSCPQEGNGTKPRPTERTKVSTWNQWGRATIRTRPGQDLGKTHATMLNSFRDATIKEEIRRHDSGRSPGSLQSLVSLPSDVVWTTSNLWCHNILSLAIRFGHFFTCKQSDLDTYPATLNIL